MKASKLLVLALIGLAITSFVVLDLGRYLSLDALRQSQASLASAYAENPWSLRAGFFAVYVAVASLSLPGAAILTLLAGAVAFEVMRRRFVGAWGDVQERIEDAIAREVKL